MYTITEGTEFERARALILLKRGVAMGLVETPDFEVLAEAPWTRERPRMIFADVVGHLFMANFAADGIDGAWTRWRKAIADGKDNIKGVAEELDISLELVQKLSFLHHQTSLRSLDIIYLLEGKPLRSLEPFKRKHPTPFLPDRPVA